MDGTRNPGGAGREIQPAFSVPVHSVEQANPEPRIMRLRSDHPQVELSWGTQLFSDRPKVRDVKHGCHRCITCSAAAAAVRILAAAAATLADLARSPQPPCGRSPTC